MNKLKYINNEKGLTLVEMLVALLISALITGAISSYLVVHIKTFEVSQDIIDLQYEAQLSVNEMSKSIMESRGLKEIQIQGATTVVDLEGINNIPDVKMFALVGLGSASSEPAFHVYVNDVTTGNNIVYYYGLTDTDLVGYSDNIYQYISDQEALSEPFQDGDIFAKNIVGMDIKAAQSSFSNTSTASGIELMLSEAEGIELILYLEKGDNTDLTVRSIAKYRNIKPE